MTERYRLAVLNSHPIQYFAPLYRYLAQFPELEVTVYYCSRQGLDGYADDGFKARVKWDVPLTEGYEHHFLPNLRGDHRVGGYFSLVNPSIVRELARGRYDGLLVHGHSYVTNLMAIAAAKLLRIPVFMRCETHLHLQRSAHKQFLREVILRPFYRLFDACLPIGAWNAAFYRHFGVPEERLFQVPYTVDNDFFRNAASRVHSEVPELRRLAGIPVNHGVVLYASKLTSRKHPMDLILAVERLQAQGMGVSLLVVGSGEEEPRLREYVASHNTPDVHFVGFKNQTELPQYYAMSDVFVLPSENEPWGLVVNEAMASGLAVVTTDQVGAAPDLVANGENGFVVRAEDVDGLARALAATLSEPAVLQSMKRRSEQIIGTWSYEQSRTGLLDALRHSSRNRGRQASTNSQISNAQAKLGDTIGQK